ncbi:MAG: FMN-binding protein [Myxococcota bacterium]
MNARRPRKVLLPALLVLLAVAVAPRTASAQAVHWTKADLLREFFSRCDRVTYEKLSLTPAQRRSVKKHLGYTVRTDWTVYYGLKNHEVQGYAIIDDEMGQHRPITFGVLIDPEGRAQRLEVMVYREAHGDEIREGRFRKQFEGKTPDDPVRHGADIVAISGATISSKAMAKGVRRALAVFRTLVLEPDLDLAERR